MEPTSVAFSGPVFTPEMGRHQALEPVLVTIDAGDVSGSYVTGSLEKPQVFMLTSDYLIVVDIPRISASKPDGEMKVRTIPRRAISRVVSTVGLHRNGPNEIVSSLLKTRIHLAEADDQIKLSYAVDGYVDEASAREHFDSLVTALT
ncbi:MAG: hypothetical protein LC808_15925 [Actinobacteria bacterium]|nr:hypothetical protein [Actinomycetota bacterium]